MNSSADPRAIGGVSPRLIATFRDDGSRHDIPVLSAAYINILTANVKLSQYVEANRNRPLRLLEVDPQITRLALS